MIAKKKILPILLAVLMVFAMMPIAARTVHADSKIVVNCVEYTLNADETATVSGRTDDLPEGVVIPGTVTSNNVIYTVTDIGQNAFSWCDSLTSITIPASVTSIEESAFYGCSSLGAVVFEEGSNLQSIGNSTFVGCEKLTSITIPASVTSIEESAFYGCSSLGAVVFEEGSNLKTIGNGAFRTIAIKNLTIPASVTSIGESAFSVCESLETVGFAEGCKLGSIAKDAFIGCGKLTSITIPASVTSIGEGAFMWCEKLTSITIPAGVTIIEKAAFYGCDSLTTIHFDGSRSQWEAITGGGKPAIELVDFGVEDPKADVSLNLSFYKKETETWIDADNDTCITSATINGTDTRSTKVPVGATATISIAPAAGYMVQGVTVNGSPRVWEVPDFRSWTDQETGIHTITFTPAEGESYAFSVSLHEAVRVTYDLNGGTTGDDWLGSTRLVSKGSVETAIGYEFDKITPPNGKVLSSVEMTTGGKLYTITAADLYSTAHTYNSDVTFKCIWESNQPDPDPQPQPGPQPQPAAQTITASNITKTYGNADFNLNAKTSGDGKLTYKSANTNVVTVDSTGKVTIKGAGTANVTISAAATANYKAAARTITITVNKAGNLMTVKANTVRIKAEKLAVKKQTIKAPKAFKITGAQGRVTYKVTKYDKKAKKKIKVSKAGKITVKKGLKKGTYKLKVNVTAAGNTNYEPLAKMVTVKIKVK